MQKENLIHVQNFLESLLRPIIDGAVENSFKKNLCEQSQLPQTKIESPPDRFIDSKEVGKIFNVSDVSIWDWEKRGLLKAYRIGRLKRFKLNEVMSSPKAIERGIKTLSK